MVAFYKHDIAPWMDATADLSHEAYRLFHVVCQMIYLNEGPVRLNERYLAGACRLSLRGFRPALTELVNIGCLTLVDGVLTNSRAEEELENVSKNRENASNGGKNSGRTRRNKKNGNEVKAAEEAALQQDRSLIEKTRLDYSVSSDTGAGAPIDLLGEATPPPSIPSPSDPDYWRKQAFSTGVQTVRRLTGKGDSAARTIVGKWMRDTRDDARRVIRAIEDAEAEQAVDPVAWISRALNQRARPSQSVEQMLFARH